MESAGIPVVSAEAAAPAGLGDEPALRSLSPLDNALLSAGLAPVVAPALAHERGLTVCAASSNRLAGSAAYERLTSPFGLQPVLREPMRDSRGAASELEADLLARQTVPHQDLELVARDPASRRMLGMAVRAEAVLPDPLGDGRRVLPKPASDLREGETLMEQPFERLSVHEHTFASEPDGSSGNWSATPGWRGPAALGPRRPPRPRRAAGSTRAAAPP